ncbi:MAG TPA: 30S ribosomal protein S20 [Candidatus Omnitrophota bacterium]|nr:30S ribosomal protein S20 [Candidatus Omnitrophota bacterium]
MPITHSAAKHIRADKKKRLRNQAAISELHTLVKKLRTLVKEDPSKAKEFARFTIKRIDKAASNGIVPRKRSDRKKARITSLLQKAKIQL